MKSNLAPYHRGIFLSDPEETGGDVLFVRLSSFDAKRHGDCYVLDSSDYGELTKPTVVFYPGAIVGQAEKWQAIIDSDKMRPITALPPLTLRKILEEVQTTEELAENSRRVAASPNHPKCAES